MDNSNTNEQQRTRSVVMGVKTIELTTPIKGLENVKHFDLTLLAARDDGKGDFIRALVDLKMDVPGLGETSIGRFRIGITSPVRALPPRVQNEALQWEDDPKFPKALKDPAVTKAIELAVVQALHIKVDLGELNAKAVAEDMLEQD